MHGCDPCHRPTEGCEPFGSQLERTASFTHAAAIAADSPKGEPRSAGDASEVEFSHDSNDEFSASFQSTLGFKITKTSKHFGC